MSDVDYGAVYDQDQTESANANLQGAHGVAPAAALGAIDAAPQSGVDPSVGMHAPDNVVPLAQLRGSQEALDASPALRTFAARSPAHVAATRDDWPALRTLGAAADSFLNGGYRDALSVLHRNYTEATSDIRAPASPGEFIQRTVAGQQRFFSNVGAAVNIAQTAMDPFHGATTRLGTQALVGAVGPEHARKILQGVTAALAAVAPGRNLPGMALAVEGAAGAEGARVPTPPPPHPIVGGWRVGAEGEVVHPGGEPVVFATPQEAAPWVVQAAKITPPGVRLEITPGAEAGTVGVREVQTASPSPGLRPEADAVHVAQADAAAQEVQGLEEAVAATQTAKRSPALTEQFLSDTALQGQTAWVNPQALAGLYAEGLSPFPAHAAAISDALTSGRDVAIPMPTYLAGVSGQPYADTLRTATRFTEDGVSQEEAKGLGQAEPDTAKPEGAPAVEAGHAPVQRPEPTLPEDITPAEVPRSLNADARFAIDEVFVEQMLSQLFTEPKALGLTTAQFDRYNNGLEEAKADVHDRVLQRTYRQIRAERTPEWKAAVEKRVGELTPEIEALPVVQAMRQLSETGFKLNRDLTSNFYPEPYTRLPKGILHQKGNHPDEAAELLGFSSGAQMVADLADLASAIKASGAKNLNDYVRLQAKGAAEAEARDALGYDISPEGLLAAAREAVTEGPVEDFLTKELKLLAEMAKLPFSANTVKAGAELAFEKLPVKEATNPALFTRGMWSNGSRLEAALSKQNWPVAFDLRQKQFFNYLQLKMAFKAQKTLRSTNALMRRWAGSQTVGGTDPLVGAILQDAVQDLGFRLERDTEELARYLTAARADGRPYDLPTLNTEASNQGEVIDLVPRPPGPPADFPWGDFVDYTNQLKALQKFGAELQSITSHGKAWALLDFGNTVAANADAIGRKYTPQQLHDARTGVFNRLKGSTQALLVGNLRPEVYLHWVDGDKQGPLMGLVNQLQTGKYLETDLSAGWVEAMKASVPSSFWGQMGTKVNAPPEMAVQTVNGPVEVMQTRGNLRHALLYLGSESGRTKLLDGYGWDEAAERWLLDNATIEDWQFVRAFWAENEKLFALADAAYMKRRGYGLPRDILREVDTGNPEVGTLAGGHVHVTYDPTLKDRMRIVAVEGEESPSDLKATYGTPRPGGDVTSMYPASALPSAFYAIKRTGFTGPVMLNPRALSSGVAEVIHDLAYRDALVNAQKGLTQPLVSDALESVLGPEYGKQVLPWLRYIAQERMLFDPSTEALVRGINSLTSNFVWAEVAWNVASALKHGGVGAIHMAAEVKNPLALMGGMRDTWGLGPKADMWRKFVTDNSGEVRGLRFNNDASLSAILNQDAFLSGAYGTYKDWGYALFTLSKYFEAQATWLGKYREAIGENGDHALSVSIADKAVRDTQGAGHPVDLAPLLRRSDTAIGAVGRMVAGKLMGFRNTAPNRMFTAKRQLGLGVRQMGQGEAGAGAANVGKAGMGIGAFVIAAAIWIAWQEIFLRGGGDPKAKSKGDAFGEELGWALAENSAGSFIGPNALLDPLKFGSAQADKLKAAWKHLEAGEIDRIHGAWKLALEPIAQATGALPVSGLKAFQAIADEIGDDLTGSERAPVPLAQRAILGRAPHYTSTGRSARRSIR